MRIHVRSKQIELAENLHAYIERRLEFSLGRFSPRIQRVTVLVTDVNGPRGGEDKLCRIEVRMQPTGTVFVEDRGEDLVATIDRGAERIGRSVGRTIERERERGRRTRRKKSASSPSARAYLEDSMAE
jgi:putative sigma-54 modulation protein